MSTPRLKSQPTYRALTPDLGGRCHVLVSRGEGREALLRLAAQLPPGAESHVLGLGEPPATEAELLAELDRTLAGCVMGTRLYAAGAESFLGAVVRLARQHGMADDEIRCEHHGSSARRVYCVHCRTTTEGVKTTVVLCAGCGRHLFVRDHYSRRLAAYMGVMADAEVPGELPPITEAFT